MDKKLIFATILILSCAQPGSDYYPLFTGAERIYEVERITILGNDTIQSRTKQKTKIETRRFHDYWGEIWEVTTKELGSLPVNAFVRKSRNELLLILNLNDTLNVFKQFNFPLEVGKMWIVAKLPNDTFVGKVINLESIEVPVGRFDSCYKVEIKTKRADFNRNVWLAPNIGIVKNEIEASSFQDKIKKVTIEKSVLIQYNTKPTKG